MWPPHQCLASFTSGRMNWLSTGSNMPAKTVNDRCRSARMYVGKTQARSEFIRDFLGDRRSSASDKLQFDGEALFKYFFRRRNHLIPQQHLPLDARTKADDDQGSGI